MMQQPTPQQSIPGMNPNQQTMEKLDNISKVKTLLPSLKESLKNLFLSAAALLNQNR
jgi:hypothetical protein